jgi:porin
MKRIAILAGLLAAVAAPAAAQTGIDGATTGAAQPAPQIVPRLGGPPLTDHLLDWGQVSALSSVATGHLFDRDPMPAQTGVAPVTEHLFGDWGGLRTKLENAGIYLYFDALTEFAGNVSGGTKQGATFASQVAFEADIDWQRLAGISGLSSHMIIVNRSGVNDSTLFGDRLLPVQEIYGAGGNVAAHLVSTYIQEILFDGRLDLAAGRMNVENDFASSPLYCNFMNNVLCGDPKALPGGDIGLSAYPDGVWGGRVRVRPTSDSYVAVGVYEVSQGLYGNDWCTGFEFDGAQDSGVYVPVEVGYEPRIGASQMPGHYKVGFGYDTSNTFTDFSAALHPGVRAPRHTGNTQLWLLADQMLLRQGPGDQDGILVLGGYIHNNPPNSVYADQVFAGVVDRGFWAARPQDAMALLFTYNTVSGSLGNVQAQELSLGLPLSNSATGVQTHEMVLEVNYNVHVWQGVSFQPDFQYVIRPNAQANIHNAAVFGFRAHVWF